MLKHPSSTQVDIPPLNLTGRSIMLDSVDNQDNKSINGECSARHFEEMVAYEQKSHELMQEVALLRQEMKERDEKYQVNEAEFEKKIIEKESWLEEYKKIEMQRMSRMVTKVTSQLKVPLTKAQTDLIKQLQ